MMYTSAFRQFVESLKAISSMPRNNAGNDLMVASAFVLIASSFESYVENACDEFVDSIKGLNIREIPIGLLKSYVAACSDYNIKNGAISGAVKSLHPLTTGIFSPKIDFKMKFNYGKHGGTELERVLIRAGADQQRLTESFIYSLDNGLGGKMEVNLFKRFDEITDRRNIILHTANFRAVDYLFYKQSRRHLLSIAHKVELEIIEIKKRHSPLEVHI